MISKGKEDVLKLINAISDLGRIQVSDGRKSIAFPEGPNGICFVLHEGAVSIYRKVDELLLANVQSPAMLGTNFLSADDYIGKIILRGKVSYEMIPRTELVAALGNDSKLWGNYSYYLMHAHRRLMDIHFNAAGFSSYRLLCNCLIELMNEGENFRNSYKACDYIRDRTNLSRSGIMQMLSDLRKGGYIEMNRGVLVKVNHLPARY